MKCNQIFYNIKREKVLKSFEKIFCYEKTKYITPNFID